MGNRLALGVSGDDDLASETRWCGQRRDEGNGEIHLIDSVRLSESIIISGPSSPDVGQDMSLEVAPARCQGMIAALRADLGPLALKSDWLSIERSPSCVCRERVESSPMRQR
jgi:hypothetical protein